MSSYDPIRPRQHAWRNRETDLLCGLKIDDELELYRLFERLLCPNWKAKRKEQSGKSKAVTSFSRSLSAAIIFTRYGLLLAAHSDLMTLSARYSTDWRIVGLLGRALTFVAAGGYYGYMKKASVSDLKNQISRYLDYVKQGETVLVLDRTVPVAELKPVTGKSSSDKLVALERKGIIRLGSGNIPKQFFKGKLGGKRAKTLDALLEEREKGR